MCSTRAQGIIFPTFSACHLSQKKIEKSFRITRVLSLRLNSVLCSQSRTTQTERGKKMLELLDTIFGILVIVLAFGGTAAYLIGKQVKSERNAAARCEEHCTECATE